MAVTITRPTKIIRAKEIRYTPRTRLLDCSFRQQRRDLSHWDRGFRKWTRRRESN